MRISKLVKQVIGDVARVECVVTWEEQEREPFVFYAEVGAEFSDSLWADPNGFVIAALLPAWKQGEKRVLIEGTLCPYFHQRVRAALALFLEWYPELGPPPVIEAGDGFKALNPISAAAACFLSCGIDSLATLRARQLLLPADHPSMVKATVSIDFVYRFGDRSAEEEANRTRKRFRMASQIAGDLGVIQINLKTNVMGLESDGYFYAYKWYGSVMVAMAHFLSRGFGRFIVAGGESAAYLGAWGSHPLVEPHFSSAHMAIEYDGLEMSRLDKLTLVAEWPVGLQNIFVCEGKNSGDSNCGSCEKCIQAMTGLLSLGALKRCSCFPVRDVSPDMLDSVRERRVVFCDYISDSYWEFIPGLKRFNRPDLVDAVDELVDDFEENGPYPL